MDVGLSRARRQRPAAPTRCSRAAAFPRDSTPADRNVAGGCRVVSSARYRAFPSERVKNLRLILVLAMFGADDAGSRFADTASASRARLSSDRIEYLLI